MPKKKKVTKAEAKASIKRLHKASKHRERLEVRAVKPIVTRELPPQPAPEVKEPVEAKPVELPQKPVEAPEEVPETEEPEHKEPHKKIAIGESIEFGWSAVKSHLVFFICIFLLFAALSFMSYGAGAIGTQVVLGLLVSGISLGYIKLSIDMVDGKAPEFKELFSCFSLLLKYLIAAIIYTIVVAIGLVLFVIPGVIWAVQFGFYPYVIVKERLGPLSALRKSSTLTAGVKGKLIIFAFALLGINLLGVVALGIGIIITMPMSVIAAAHVFRQLEKHSSSQ